MTEQLHTTTLIVVCGWAVSGKTTIAKELGIRLGLHRIDIDDLRVLTTGKPHPSPDDSPDLMEKDRQEMAMAYRMLRRAAELNLESGRSLIITATFSSTRCHEDISAIQEAFPNTRVRIIQCLPTNDGRDEIERRLARRSGEYRGSVNSYARYLEVKERYTQMEIPLVTLDTSPPNTVGVCVQQVLEYITAE